MDAAPRELLARVKAGEGAGCPFGAIANSPREIYEIWPRGRKIDAQEDVVAAA